MFERKLPPEGWYVNPAGEHDARWWDGSAWTERVLHDGLEAVDPVNAKAISPLAKRPPVNVKPGTKRAAVLRRNYERDVALRDKQDARALDRARKAFFDSPIGQARAAKRDGLRYFQTEMPLIDTARTLSSWINGDVATKTRHNTGQGAVLTAIEEEGWELVQAGFVYHETGQVSRDKLLSSGQSIRTTGQTIGVYLFRATEEPARTDEVWASIDAEVDEAESAQPNP